MKTNDKKAILELLRDTILKIDAIDALENDAPMHVLHIDGRFENVGGEHCARGTFKFAIKNRFGIEGEYVYVLDGVKK